MRWRVNGGVYGVTCNTKRLWDTTQGANSMITAFTFKLSDCIFPAEPEGRHMTNWFTGESVTIKHFWAVADRSRGGQLTEDEIKQVGLDNKTASLKVIMEPFLQYRKKNMSVKLRVVAVPGDLDYIKVAANKWNVNVQDPSQLPTLALMNDKDRYTIIPLGLDELEGDDMGLGVISMVEVKTNVENFSFPSRDDMAKEQQAFFRDWQLANVVRHTANVTVEAVYKAQERMVGELAFKPRAEWPIIYSTQDPDEAGKT